MIGAFPMSDVALYYPHVHPRDEAWLKQAVLYWPIIERIVPGGYLMSDTAAGQLLQQANILTEREPGPAAEIIADSFSTFVDAHAQELRGRFSLHHAEALEPQPGWNDEHFDLRFGWVHGQKIADPLVDALCDAGLAMRAYGQWIGMHPALSDVYMCALAAEMATEGRNTPITDRTLHHVAAAGWTFEDLARALLPDADVTSRGAPPPHREPEDVVVTLAVQSVALRDLRDVPIERTLLCGSLTARTSNASVSGSRSLPRASATTSTTSWTPKRWLITSSCAIGTPSRRIWNSSEKCFESNGSGTSTTPSAFPSYLRPRSPRPRSRTSRQRASRREQ